VSSEIKYTTRQIRSAKVEFNPPSFSPIRVIFFDKKNFLPILRDILLLGSSSLCYKKYLFHNSSNVFPKQNFICISNEHLSLN